MKEILIAVLGGYVGWYLALNKEAETRQALTQAKLELSKLRDELVDKTNSTNQIDMMHEKKWAEKTTKEKLDLVFVCVAIVTFSLTAYMHIKNLRKGK